MFLSEWREFPSAPCLAGKINLMAARVSMLLKSRASVTCFQACFLPGQAKDLSAPLFSNTRCHNPLELEAYRGADKSLALQGRKQANVSVRMA